VIATSSSFSWWPYSREASPLNKGRNRDIYGDNSFAVTIPREGRVATLWKLTWKKVRVTCVVYQAVEGMQLRLESGKGILFTEPFEMQPRNFARTRALRESLKRRGWTEE
jgi:hypothetical protein